MNRTRVPGDGPACWCGQPATFGGSCSTHYNTDTGCHTPRPRNYPVRNYPVRDADGARPEEDQRFAIGLVLFVADEMKRRGYPELSGLDMVDLQQALFRFLYCDREVV